MKKLLRPLQNWLDNLPVENPRLAHLLCSLIPSTCPFERDVVLFQRTLFHIPALCTLNPFYEQLVGLRFKALCYLADCCGEDVTRYIV
ncbi:Mo-dependent nitrogenase C-terminal domain-containing protein [Anthocerotibacter panamensis]|uniref:Mo-dependent nitrogenase C-terminal domain-containing protein n=1 Tax=Anthocerotibacter panamensis TaxID=2857077 RepID=UPI001C4041DC|nr:Mo-dependent nitrogenase C-terminal domain-containing protein [Anthocerotibacter panamensis]